MISVYNHQTEIDCTTRRIELFESYNKLIKWGRENPVAFAEAVWGIRLMDLEAIVLLHHRSRSQKCVRKTTH